MYSGCFSPVPVLLRGCCLSLLLASSSLMPAHAQGSRADYDRALSLAKRTENKVFRAAVKANWLPDQPHFWYRVATGPDAHEFLLVDAENAVRAPAFDHTALAQALSQATEQPLRPERLGVDQLEFAPDLGSVRFRHAGRLWRWDRRANTLTPDPAEPATRRSSQGSLDIRPSRRTGDETTITFVNRLADPVEVFWIDSEGERRNYGRVHAGARREQHTFAGHVWLVTDALGQPLAVFEADEAGLEAEIDGRAAEPERRTTRRRPPEGTASPDGRWLVFLRDFNVHLRDTRSGESWTLSRDGAADDAYAPAITWAPDSSRFVALRVRKGQEHKVHFVEAAPRDQLQPKLHTRDYLKPGDVLPRPRPVLFTVADRRCLPVDDALFPNPFTESGDLEIRWAPDGSEFFFDYNQRGHQLYRILAVNSETAGVRVVVEESSTTFVDYSNKTWRHWLPASNELLWMSERDGWAHLWLYDVATGQPRHPLTRGPWVVRRVEHVDETARQVWFFAGGIRPEQDPYHLHLCRVDFDGANLTVLTEGDGTHRVEFSPDRRWFIDTWSRVDHPPVIELRRSKDGRRVCELERADWSALLAEGWTVPERLVAPGRAGQTEIHGILIRPSRFDPARRYPVIEEIYAGPHGAHVPKEFGRLVRQHALAELGFVIVQIDGQGTNHRGKQFHDVCWQNLADAGFPDRIAWLRAAARTRAWMDLSRVGIYGGSAGGQNALRALLDHGDFYHVAVADCGCHDNRMDKIWWNEAWLGWPINDGYLRSSNVADAHKLQGKLLLIVGEVDTNVDPASTLQVADALIRADKDFDLLIMTSTNHGAAETPYASRRRMDFFVRHLLGVEPRHPGPEVTLPQ